MADAAKHITAFTVLVREELTGSKANDQPSMMKYIEKLDGSRAGVFMISNGLLETSERLGSMISPVPALYIPALMRRNSSV